MLLLNFECFKEKALKYKKRTEKKLKDLDADEADDEKTEEDSIQISRLKVKR